MPSFNYILHYKVLDLLFSAYNTHTHSFIISSLAKPFRNSKHCHNNLLNLQD